MTVKGPVNVIINGAFLCLCIFLSQISATQSATPLQTHDMNPLTLVYGLPLVSPARLSQQSSFGVSLNVSNTINTEDKNNELLLIDGETSELNLIYSFPVNDKSSFRIRLPFISHEAGSLDSFIDDFHQTFGFPEGDRPNFANNQFLFLYQLNNADVVRIDQANSGIGDVSFDLAFQAYANNKQAGSLWSSIKLPTGDSETLTGSKEIDVAVWYATEYQFHPDWSRYYNIGLLIAGKSDILADLQKTDIYFGTAGIEWQTTAAVTLNIQLDFHTAFYETQTTFLGDSIQISSGGHIQLSASSRLDIVVVEDIYIGASPDVTFQLGYNLTF